MLWSNIIIVSCSVYLLGTDGCLDGKQVNLNCSNVAVTDKTVIKLGEQTPPSIVYKEEVARKIMPNATELTIPQLAQSQIFYKIGRKLNAVWNPILVPIGLACNTLSILVMSLKRNRKISCCTYMTALAVCDNGMLLIAGNNWLILAGYPRLQSALECQLSTCFTIVVTVTASILLISMTLDRLIVVKFPLKARTICTARRAKIVIFISFISTSLYGLPFLKLSGVSRDGLECVIFLKKTLFTQVCTWVTTCLNILLPFTTLLVLNTLIIRTMWNRNVYFDKQKMQPSNDVDIRASPDTSTSTCGNGNKQTTKDTQLVVMLLWVTFTYLALTFPIYLHNSISTIIDYQQSAEKYALNDFSLQLTRNLFRTNSGVNFFLYIISGSKFRHETWMILSCQCKKI